MAKTTHRLSSGKQILIPIAALFLLAIFNFITDPLFFAVSIDHNSQGFPVLSGNLITVIDNASELVILAIGMTLVTSASCGQDISVGSVIAVSASILFRVLCGSDTNPEVLHSSILTAFLISCTAAMILGAFNGILVSHFGIQPMIATLILYTAGRSVAAWINNNELPVITDPSFAYFGNFFPGLPVPAPILMTLCCIIFIAFILRFSKLKLYTQASGINPETARLNGINYKAVRFSSFVILGFFCAVAALIKASRIQTINYSVIAKDIELDVILAVALGGNSLSGGKFSMTSSILGAYVLQFLTVTLYKLNVSSTALPAYKAAVVIILVILSSPVVRSHISLLRNKRSEQISSKGGLT